MDMDEMLQRIEIEQKLRLQESERLVQYREDSIIGDPDSYGDDDELTYEAQKEMERLTSMIEQYKRGYHHALDSVKKMLKGEPSEFTHDNVSRQYE